LQQHLKATLGKEASIKQTKEAPPPVGTTDQDAWLGIFRSRSTITACVFAGGRLASLPTRRLNKVMAILLCQVKFR
jgi:hypothetical protein